LIGVPRGLEFVFLNEFMIKSQERPDLPECMAFTKTSIRFIAREENNIELT